MAVLTKINRKSISTVFNTLALFTFMVLLDILLFGGFSINTGNYKVSATELQKPLLLTLILMGIGKVLAPEISFIQTPLGRLVQWVKKTYGNLEKQRSRPSFFWVTLIFLNLLLFLPPYIFQITESTFLPIPPLDGARGWIDTLLYFIRRSNQDLFRLSADFYLMITILFLLAKTRWYQIARRISVSIYLLFLLYLIYESAYLKIFGQKPLFYSDILLLRDAVYLVIDLWSWKLLDTLLKAIIWVLIIWCLIHFSFGTVSDTLHKMRINISTIITGISIWLIIFVSTLWYDPFDARPAIRWISPKIGENIIESFRGYRSLNSKFIKHPDQFNFSEFPLETKLNIYLIMIESYGKIVVTHPNLMNPYSNLTQNIEDSLTSHGWHSITQYSRSPISGGKSWLSAATVLSGIRIANQATYSLLTRRLTNYPHLIRYLQSQGFVTFGLYPPMRPRPGFSFSYHEAFYHFDTWIYYDSLDYKGEPFGWGMVPDQYSLQYAHSKFLNLSSQPYFLFFPTVTSHTPWYDLPPLLTYHLANYRPKVYPEEQFIHPNADQVNPGTRNRITGHLRKQLGFKDIFRLKDYMNQMVYQLSFITDYIIHRAPPNSLFILIGDHQPPIITKKSDGFQTPIHIISKDPDFLHTFYLYGFEDGFMKNPEDRNIINHEGMFSLLIRNLVARYSPHYQGPLPPYQPDGIPLSVFLP